MIKGYKKLKDVGPGELIRTRSGSYAFMTEYYTFSDGKNTYYDAYLLGSGEALYMDMNEWVAIIDLGFVEVNVSEELEYPS
jgi:hypothetical protein